MTRTAKPGSPLNAQTVENGKGFSKKHAERDNGKVGFSNIRTHERCKNEF